MDVKTLALNAPVDPKVTDALILKYFDQKNPDAVTFTITPYQIRDVTDPIGINWVGVYAAMAFSTNNFLDISLIVDKKNPCSISDSKGMVIYQTMRDGITAGVKFLMDSKIKDFSELTNGAKILAIYSDMLSYCYGDTSVIVPPITPLPIQPLPPLPPDPVTPKPAPAPSSSPAWYAVVREIIVVIAGLDFVAKFFIPGGVQAIISGAITVLQNIFK